MDGYCTGRSCNSSQSISTLLGWISNIFEHDQNVDDAIMRGRITLSTFLQFVVNDDSVNQLGYVNLQTSQIVKGTMFEKDDLYFQISLERGDHGEVTHYELIIADLSGKKKRMAILTAESVDSELVEMDSRGMRGNVIIDLNFGGRRWEGGELNGKPFGFGREYSEDDNLVYEGFVFEGKKVCFGKEWNDDSNNNCLVYKGGYCNNGRWGKGISYDLNGNVDFDGEWLNNHAITGNENDLMNDLIVPMSIEEYVIGKKMFNDENITTLYFSPLLTRLKRIEIGNECFQHVREFVIDGLESLESVKIGEDCFRIDYGERDDGVCRITNCPNLRQLEIGDNSFEDFKSFELSNVNSLQSIKFGNECFYYAVFSLKGECKERRKEM